MKTALAVGAALAALAAAQPAAADTLLVVPDSVATGDAHVVARYESFSLVEATGDDVARLRRAGADRRDDMRLVETAAGELDPAVEREALTSDRERVLALVQFVGPPKDAWVERLRATGAQLLTYQAENAYIVHARGDAVDRLAALQTGDRAVRAVSVMTAADKLEDRTSESGIFAVTTLASAPARAASRPPITVGALRTDFVALSQGEAARLAADPGVVAIEAHSDPEPLDERAAQIVAGNLVAPALTQPAGPAYRDWLEAMGFDDEPFGFAIDVTDSGLDNGAHPPAHTDFASRVAYRANHTADPDARDCRGHGTNVASIAAGAGAAEDDQGFDHGLGIAPLAKVGASKIFDCNGTAPSFNPVAVAAAAHAGGARISNNSWGAGQGEYSVFSAVYDALVRDASPDPGAQPLVEVFAAGNDGRRGYGTVGDEASAKNVITVGAAESVRASGTDGCGVPDAGADSARDIIDFSSRGPTFDGRLKPDLVAPGTHVLGAAPQHPAYAGTSVCNKFLAGSTTYSLSSGTSQAAPQVSGAAALVRRWYERAHGGPPSPALTKALLVNTATDLAGGQNGKGATVAAGPNHDQGWGRVNLGTVFDGTPRDLRDQTDTLGASGDRRARAYSVPDPGAPVKVTLAWTDAPGPTTGNPVVNDLDLVVDAGGRSYKGNVFAGAFSRTGGAADPRNNVESVYLPPGTELFSVRVVGTTIAGDGVPSNGDTSDQDYALVVSNAEPAPAPVLVQDSTLVDDGGDGDGALEPGEPFTLDERLLNAGDATASAVTGTLAGADLAIGQATSAWPELGADARATNATRFTGTLSADATCGAPVEATLSLTTSAGPQTVPLTLPTGATGAPVARTQTLSPRLTIPDDNPVGISSTIEVAAAGVIKDLDVRIGDIDHPWVGDLRIDLVGPDGTSVTLAAQPGGVLNFGDDFVNTVFDDEAATDIAAGAAPYTGRFRPQDDQLSRFDGKQQQGIWTLRVRDLYDDAVGTLGGWGTATSPATCSIAPLTAIDSGPADGSTSTSASPTFAFSSEVAGATFECRLDGSAFRSCVSPRKYGGLADGSHTFEVRSVSGGKPDPTPAARTWTIDATAPSTTITGGPSGRVADAAASFAFEAPGATFECSLDGAAFAACTSPQAYDGLAEGDHTFQVRARDALGNTEAAKSRAWTIDTTAPAVTITSAGATISGTAGAAAGDSGTVTVTIDKGARTLTATRDAAGAWAVDVSLPPGDHTARAEQADDALPANVGQSDELAFRIAAPPPETTVTEPPPPATVVPPPPAPSFLAVAVKGKRATVLAGCASACELRINGKRRVSLPAAGTALARVKLKGRRRATLTVGGTTLTLPIRRSVRAVASDGSPVSAKVRRGRLVVVAGTQRAVAVLR
jgi:subtilisin-like proprotein convertase family protein